MFIYTVYAFHNENAMECLEHKEQNWECFAYKSLNEKVNSIF